MASEEDWDTEVSPATAPASYQSGFQAPPKPYSCGRGKWFPDGDAHKEKKPGVRETEWNKSTQNETQSFSTSSYANNGNVGGSFSDNRQRNNYRRDDQSKGGGFRGDRDGRDRFDRDGRDRGDCRDRFDRSSNNYRERKDNFRPNVDRNGGGFRGHSERGGRREGGGGDSTDHFSNTWNESDVPAGGYGNRDNYKRRDYSSQNDDGQSYHREEGGRGRGRGGGRGGFSGRDRDQDREGDDGNKKEEGEEEDKRPPIYVPPEKTYDEETEIPSGINFEKFSDIPVHVTGDDAPMMINAFQHSGLHETLIENIKRAKYVNPTPVQKYSIPIVMAGRDIMSCAQTGSGKTAAYLLPILHNLMDKVGGDSYNQCQEPFALIVVPTRELADQIYAESYKFARNTNIKCVAVYGGIAGHHIYRQLNVGCHVLVATTGRLLDIVERGKVSFARVEYLVLDEADRMLDMGFLPDINKIVKHEAMPPKSKRHTLMYSATFPEEIQNLARDLMNDYLFVAVGTVGGANEDVEQNFHQVDQYDKKEKLMEVLGANEKTLIFIEQKRSADFLASYLSQKGLSSTSIHGDRFQPQREEALRDFKRGKRNFLVATSVASRGLDIKGVDHVVNFDLPNCIEEYVHRIGRTGRVGNLGKATSFYCTAKDQPLARALVKMLKDAQKCVPVWLEEEARGTCVSYSGSTASGAFGGRDIRQKDNFQSSAPNWDGNPPNSASLPTETECWD